MLDSRDGSALSRTGVSRRRLLVGGGGAALAQLWLFWVAPIIGAVIAGFAYSWLAVEVGEPVVGEPGPATA